MAASKRTNNRSESGISGSRSNYFTPLGLSDKEDEDDNNESHNEEDRPTLRQGNHYHAPPPKQQPLRARSVGALPPSKSSKRYRVPGTFQSEEEGSDEDWESPDGPNAHEAAKLSLVATEQVDKGEYISTHQPVIKASVKKRSLRGEASPHSDTRGSSRLGAVRSGSLTARQVALHVLPTKQGQGQSPHRGQRRAGANDSPEDAVTPRSDVGRLIRRAERKALLPARPPKYSQEESTIKQDKSVGKAHSERMPEKASTSSQIQATNHASSTTSVFVSSDPMRKASIIPTRALVPYQEAHSESDTTEQNPRRETADLSSQADGSSAQQSLPRGRLPPSDTVDKYNRSFSPRHRLPYSRPAQERPQPREALSNSSLDGRFTSEAGATEGAPGLSTHQPPRQVPRSPSIKGSQVDQPQIDGSPSAPMVYAPEPSGGTAGSFVVNEPIVPRAIHSPVDQDQTGRFTPAASRKSVSGAVGNTPRPSTPPASLGNLDIPRSRHIDVDVYEASEQRSAPTTHSSNPANNGPEAKSVQTSQNPSRISQRDRPMDRPMDRSPFVPLRLVSDPSIKDNGLGATRSSTRAPGISPSNGNQSQGGTPSSVSPESPPDRDDHGLEPSASRPAGSHQKSLRSSAGSGNQPQSGQEQTMAAEPGAEHIEDTPNPSVNSPDANRPKTLPNNPPPRIPQGTRPQQTKQPPGDNPQANQPQTSVPQTTPPQVSETQPASAGTAAEPSKRVPAINTDHGSMRDANIPPKRPAKADQDASASTAEGVRHVEQLPQVPVDKSSPKPGNYDEDQAQTMRSDRKAVDDPTPSQLTQQQTPSPARDPKNSTPASPPPSRPQMPTGYVNPPTQSLSASPPHQNTSSVPVAPTPQGEDKVPRGQPVKQVDGSSSMEPPSGEANQAQPNDNGMKKGVKSADPPPTTPLDGAGGNDAAPVAGTQDSTSSDSKKPVAAPTSTRPGRRSPSAGTEGSHELPAEAVSADGRSDIKDSNYIVKSPIPQPDIHPLESSTTRTTGGDEESNTSEEILIQRVTDEICSALLEGELSALLGESLDEVLLYTYSRLSAEQKDKLCVEAVTHASTELAAFVEAVVDAQGEA